MGPRRLHSGVGRRRSVAPLQPLSCTLSAASRLEQQHLALAVSADLYTWEDRGPLQLAAAADRAGAPPQLWMRGRHGAPFVWREPSGCLTMALMGESDVETHSSAIGLLTSADDGERWELVEERTPPRAAAGASGKQPRAKPPAARLRNRKARAAASKRKPGDGRNRTGL